MKITPMEIKQSSFKVRMRGYDKEEVDTFLGFLSDEFEVIIKENSSLKERLSSVDDQLSELKKKEHALSSTLLTAHDLVEEIKQASQKEAQLIIKEAELRGEEIIAATRKEMAFLRSEIEGIKRERIVFLEKAKAIVNTFNKIINIEEIDHEEIIK
ncbi:MAG TPA: DivIVA domain-containing protein [Nitrospiria bacterium]|nr:DivIVA domain-containing protein [Nitrospiria bacterium]